MELFKRRKAHNPCSPSMTILMHLSSGIGNVDINNRFLFFNLVPKERIFSLTSEKQKYTIACCEAK